MEFDFEKITQTAKEFTDSEKMFEMSAEEQQEIDTFLDKFLAE